MTDDLTARCLAEVERAMAAEPHEVGCVATGRRWNACTCWQVRDQRLAARLARMLAAARAREET